MRKKAAANFRNLVHDEMNQTKRAFRFGATPSTKRDQKWIDEAVASGSETPLTRKEMDAIRDLVLRGKK